MADQKLRIKPGLTTPLMSSGLGEAKERKLPKVNSQSTLDEDSVNLDGKSNRLHSTETKLDQASNADDNAEVQNEQDEKKLEDRRKGNLAKLEQQSKLKLIKECEGVLLVNYDWLDMPEYPSNDMVAEARKHREIIVLINVLLVVVCICAVNEWVPAWMGGSALGLLFASLAVSFSSLRKLVISTPSHTELMQERKAMEYRAIGHVRLLEGKAGLAWKLSNLVHYNSALSKPMFQSIVRYSKAKRLLAILKNRAHIRLYLLYLIEAEKAYARLKEDYFATHRKLRLDGIDDNR